VTSKNLFGEVKILILLMSSVVKGVSHIASLHKAGKKVDGISHFGTIQQSLSQFYLFKSPENSDE
jgi:hypothetical protein